MPALLESPSKEFVDLDVEINSSREQLFQTAELIDLLRLAVLPGHPHRGNAEAFRASATIEALLGNLADHWSVATSNTHAANIEAAQNRLTPCLLSLAETFGLYLPPEVVQDTPTTLLRYMDEEWHKMAGCRSCCVRIDSIPLGERRLAENRINENLGRLKPLASWISKLDPSSLSQVAHRFDRTNDLRWTLEARAFADHAIEVWIPDVFGSTPPAQFVETASLIAALPYRLGLDARTSCLAILALNDLTRAVLTRGVIAEKATRGLIEPLSQLSPLPCLS